MKNIYLCIAVIGLTTAGCGGSSTTETVTDSSSIQGTPEVTDAVSPATTAEAPVEKTADYNDKFHFKVTGEANSFTLTYTGYSADSTPFTQNIEGKVVDLQVDAMDADNYPEVAVITEDNNGNKKAYVFSSNRDKSISAVNMPDMAEKDSKGYKGQDDFAFVEQYFIHRFPVYNDDGSKSGKTRQLEYLLKPGEAMKQLVLAKTEEY